MITLGCRICHLRLIDSLMRPLSELLRLIVRYSSAWTIIIFCRQEIVMIGLDCVIDSLQPTFDRKPRLKFGTTNPFCDQTLNFLYCTDSAVRIYICLFLTLKISYPRKRTRKNDCLTVKTQLFLRPLKKRFFSPHHERHSFCFRRHRHDQNADIPTI